MADFCQACSIELFGRDLRDLAGITSPEMAQAGLYTFAICEGCGTIQVDHEGRCVTDDCLRSGHPGHGLPETDASVDVDAKPGA